MKNFGISGQFYSCRDWEERLNLKQGRMGSNTHPPAYEVGVRAIVPSYSVNNSTVGPENVDTRSNQI